MAHIHYSFAGYKTDIKICVACEALGEENQIASPECRWSHEKDYARSSIGQQTKLATGNGQNWKLKTESRKLEAESWKLKTENSGRIHAHAWVANYKFITRFSMWQLQICCLFWLQAFRLQLLANIICDMSPVFWVAGRHPSSIHFFFTFLSSCDMGHCELKWQWVNADYVGKTPRTKPQNINYN